MGGIMPDLSSPGHYALGLADAEPAVTSQALFISECFILSTFYSYS